MLKTSSRYFITQSGKELKWRVGSHRMEVCDSSNINLAWLLCRPFFSLVRRWSDNFGDVGRQPSDGRTLRQTRHKARWTAHRN